jgi:hypothetical protein
MNEQNEIMYENQKITAKALEIAIILTKADETWLHLDTNRNVIIDEPLFSTMRTVAKVLTNNVLIAVSGKPDVLPGINRRTKKS